MASVRYSWSAASLRIAALIGLRVSRSGGRGEEAPNTAPALVDRSRDRSVLCSKKLASQRPDPTHWSKRKRWPDLTLDRGHPPRPWRSAAVRPHVWLPR